MSQANTTRVVVVENDDAYRGALSALLHGEPGYTCVGAFASAEGLLRTLTASRPDIVLLDLRLPRMSGVDAIPLILDTLKEVQIVVLTVDDHPTTLYRALEAGAVGYLVKPVTLTRILEALGEARAGGSPMTSQIARMVIDTFRRRGEARRQLAILSEREQQVLAGIANGLHNLEIGRALGISPRTVAAHVRSIYDKLQVRTRSGAAARFLRPDSGAMT